MQVQRENVLVLGSGSIFRLQRRRSMSASENYGNFGKHIIKIAKRLGQ